MESQMTPEELLKLIYEGNEDQLDQDILRMVRVRVPGREVSMAHVIGTADRRIYENLGLHIGVHEGEDHAGESIGIMRFTPWEAVVPATDIAIKAANVEVGFMDRFCGTLIILGTQIAVRTALEAVTSYFRENTSFEVCDVTEG